MGLVKGLRCLCLKVIPSLQYINMNSPVGSFEYLCTYCLSMFLRVNVDLFWQSFTSWYKQQPLLELYLMVQTTTITSKLNLIPCFICLPILGPCFTNFPLFIGVIFFFYFSTYIRFKQFTGTVFILTWHHILKMFLLTLCCCFFAFHLSCIFFTFSLIFISKIVFFVVFCWPSLLILQKKAKTQTRAGLIWLANFKFCLYLQES